MIARMIVHAGFRQGASRAGVAIDPPLGLVTPCQVEGGADRIELHARVGKVVVNPPRHRSPISVRLVAVREPRHDDARRRPHATVRVAAIPNVAGVVGLVARARMPVRISKPIHQGRPVGGTDRDPSECGVQGLKQFFAEADVTP